MSGIIRSASQLGKRILRAYLDRSAAHTYGAFYSKVREIHGKDSLAHPAEGEEEWLARWATIGMPAEREAYRLWAPLTAPERRMDIVPPTPCNRIIERILNPAEYAHYYEDKNMLDRIFGRENTAGTLLHCIDGYFYDADYRPLPTPQRGEELELQGLFASTPKIIVKPAVDSYGGKGIKVYELRGAQYHTLDGKETLDAAMLMSGFGRDFIVQPFMGQHAFYASLNKSSVNAFRIVCYRSVADQQTHLVSSILRIGAPNDALGSITSGSRYIGVTPDGHLARTTMDFWGVTKDLVNGIDFGEREIRIPDYEKVKEFTIRMSERVPHMRLFSWDIAVDEGGIPKIIELNLTGFSTDMAQFCGMPALGPFAGEVIQHCRARQPKFLLNLRY